jgi:tetratricopeptide (TPR) repeat protein
MEEEFEFDFTEDPKLSVERYEEMIRNKDQYFFDAQAFENIVDYYMDKNDPIKALQVIEYAVAQHPYAAIFQIKKAQLHIFTNEINLAFKSLEKAELLEPSDADIYMIRGNIFESLDRHDDALENLKKALELAEQKDEVLMQIAFVYQNMGDYEEAIVYLKLCLENNMENQDALYELAFCYDVLEKQEESIQFYEQYINTEPYSFAAWYNLGNAFHKLSLFEKAIDAYDYAILIKDSFASAYFNKGNALVQLDRYEEAIEVYRQTFEYEQPNGDTYCAIGECYEKLEKMDEARSFYKKAVKMDPNLADAWYGIGVTLDFEERYFESLHFYKKALIIDNQNPDYWFATADAQYKLGSLKESEAAYEKVVELNPIDIEAWLDYSSIVFEQEDLPKCIEIIAEGIKNNPESAELYYRFVAYLFANGQNNEALNQLQIALNIDVEKNYLLFEYLPQLQNNKVIIDIINRFSK